MRPSISSNSDNRTLTDFLKTAHRKYRDTFNKDLSHGYNGFVGQHQCCLNWTSQQRPEARKVPIASYHHNMKGIMQEICDDLTSQGVLKIPQQHNILVQSVCPSFLKCKRRAANIPKHQLTKDHCRLLINFGPVKQFI